MLDESWIYWAAWRLSSRSQPASWETFLYSLPTPTDWFLFASEEERNEEESRRLWVEGYECRGSLFVLYSLLLFIYFSTSYFQYQDHGHEKDIPIVWEQWTGSRAKTANRNTMPRTASIDACTEHVCCLFFFGIFNYIMIQRGDETLFQHTGRVVVVLACKISARQSRPIRNKSS